MKIFSQVLLFKFYIDGLNRVNVEEYPLKAVREGFINALAHRNYERTSCFIEVYISDDCIEIINMEHIDRGISQITDEMLKFRLEEPQFSEGNDSFKVVFKSDQNYLNHDGERKNIINLKDLCLNQRQIDIVRELTNNNSTMTYDNPFTYL